MECDIWSLGVVFYEMLTGKKLFSDPNDNIHEVIDQIKFAKINIPNFISSDAADLLENMLKLDPE